MKENPLRQVWRVTLRGEIFFAKVFTDAGWTHAVRRCVHGAPERKEWRVGRYAERHDVACIRFVGLLEPTGSGGAVRAVLISKAVPNAVSLADAWQRACEAKDPAARSAAVGRLTDLVARAIADAHDKRFLHRDTHPDNILISPDADGTPQHAILADLQRTRVGRTVSDADAAANLAELAQWFRLRSTLTQRMRFLRAYLRYRHGWTAAQTRSVQARSVRRRFCHMVDAAAGRHAERLYAKRDRRMLRPHSRNRYFGAADLGGGWRGTFPLRFRRRDYAPGPSQPDRSLHEWIEWAHRELPDLGDVERCNAAAGRLELQAIRSVPKGIWELASWAVRGSPVHRVWRQGHRARNRDLPVASPVALFERRRFGLVIESVVLIERTEPRNRGA
ncbi:MAG: phosphotransferase [Phycisphaerales bacterium]|nr:MAG: phosphotransferase [Phycisphaerales bacterium]